MDPHVPDPSPLSSCTWCERLHPAPRPLSVCPGCAARYTSLRMLGMSGSFPLTDSAIDAQLTRTAPGNYALGYLEGHSFVVFYVGRSDADVRGRLHEWVDAPSPCERGAPAAQAPWATRRRGPMPLPAPARARVGVRVDSRYTRFAFSYAASAEAAFAKQCRNYADLGGRSELDNAAGPAPPA